MIYFYLVGWNVLLRDGGFPVKPWGIIWKILLVECDSETLRSSLRSSHWRGNGTRFAPVILSTIPSVKVVVVLEVWQSKSSNISSWSSFDWTGLRPDLIQEGLWSDFFVWCFYVIRLEDQEERIVWWLTWKALIEEEHEATCATRGERGKRNGSQKLRVSVWGRECGDKIIIWRPVINRVLPLVASDDGWRRSPTVKKEKVEIAVYKDLASSTCAVECGRSGWRWRCTCRCLRAEAFGWISLIRPRSSWMLRRKWIILWNSLILAKWWRWTTLIRQWLIWSEGESSYLNLCT